MRTKILSVFIICILIFSNALIIEADTSLCADDFENYEEVVGGKWVGQTSQGNEKIPLAETERGKSAKVVSTNSKRFELLYDFPRTGEQVKSIDFKFSVYLEDTNAVRSLYTRDSNRNEMRLLTFSKDSNMISTWSRTIPAEIFTYKTCVWYDIHVRYNMADGFIRIEISDGENKTVLQEIERASRTGLWRFDFASFASDAEKEAVSFIDDVDVYVSEPAFYQNEGIYLSDTFEGNFVKGTLSGYELSGGGSFDSEQTEYGKSAVISLSGGSASLSKNIDYLNDEDAVSFGFTAKSQGGKGKAEISLSDEKCFEIDFAESILKIGEENFKFSFGQKWFSISAEYIKETSLLNVTLKNDESEQIFAGQCGDISSARQIKLSAQCGESEKIYIDNLYLFASCKKIAVKEQGGISAPDNANQNIVSADFGEGIPEGWSLQPEGAQSTSASFSEGAVLIENESAAYCQFEKSFNAPAKPVKSVRYSVKLKLSDNNAPKALYLRDDLVGEFPLLKFEARSNTIMLGSVSVPSYEFTYKTGVIYDIELLYNTESGYIRAIFDDGTSVKTAEGQGRVNTLNLFKVYFVSFRSQTEEKSQSFLYSLKLDAIDPVLPLVQTHGVFESETFEPYWGNSDLKGWSISRGEGCTASPAEGRYGINVQLKSTEGNTCKIYKTYTDADMGKYFSVKFSAKFDDTAAERKISLNGINLIKFEKEGSIVLGESPVESTAFGYRANKWYTFEIEGNNETKEITARILGDTSKTLISGVMAESILSAEEFAIAGSGDGVMHFDNFSFIYKGIYDVPSFENYECVNPDTKSITLLFTDDIVSGNVRLNGIDAKNITFDGRKVTVNTEGLEKNRDYTLSYSNMSDGSGKTLYGNLRFKTGGNLEILSAGFKKQRGEDERVSTGAMAAFVNYRSFDENKKNILFAAAIYDKNSGKLLRVDTLKAEADQNIKNSEIYFEIPEESKNAELKLFMWDGALVSLCSEKYASPYIRPEGSEVVSLLRERYEAGTHPRILADENDFVRIRKLINTDAKMNRWFLQVRTVADTYLYSDPVEYVINGSTLAAPTEIRTIILTLGFMYKITGDEKYAARVYKEMENAAAYPDWNPYHYLDTATMMNAFSIGYDWTYDYISKDSAKKETILTAVKNFGFETVLEDYQNKSYGKRSYSWAISALPDNWNIICNSGALTAALAFADELPEYTEQIFSYGLPHIEKALFYFAPDGAWYEGVGYWGYFMRYLSDLLASMKVSLGTDFGLSDAPGFKDTPYFPFAMSGPGGQFNFHNCGTGFIDSPQMYFLSKLLGDEKIAALQTKFIDEGYSGGGVISMLYYDPDTAYGSAQLPLDFYFRNTEVCTMRSSWEKDANFVGFHAGQNNVSHGHLDIGEFVIDMLGERFACELGAEDYSVTSTVPWGIYRKRAEGHNTLVINPDMNPDQTPSAKAVIDRFETNDEGAVAVIDMTSAYGEKTESALRGITLCEGRNAVIIKDEVFGKEEMNLWWFMHTQADVAISDDGKSAILTRNGKSVKAEIIEGDGLIFKVMAAQPLETSPQVEGQNKNEGYRKLAINSNGKKDVKITVAISPLDYTLKNRDIKSINEW